MPLTSLTTAIILCALGQNPAPNPQPALAATPAAAPAPPPTAAELAVSQAASKVEAIRTELAKPGLSLQTKNKLKKALLRAEARAREARADAQFQQVQKERQAYVDKMMPLWLEQQRQNAQFNIEAAKARALQQMAITAELKRQDDLYFHYQR
jgi:hypothetical protein